MQVIEGRFQHDWLAFDARLARRWLVTFLQDECIRKRRTGKAVIALSGGIDSAVSAALCAEAFGPESALSFFMPYKVSSPQSQEDARLVADHLGIPMETIDITAMADGYLDGQDANPERIGNVCARCRFNILYDQSAKHSALPMGTSNKTERLFGYYTWHADDSPPINPIGDLFKTQVWELARELDLPDRVIDKAPTADLEKGQTDEGDLGISYAMADQILARMLRGLSDERIAEDFPADKVARARKLLEGTHWKRHSATTAMLTDTAINEYYLRPVDYRGAER